MEFLSFGILVVQFCNKIHGLLRFKFPKLTYRKRIGSYLPLLWDPYVSDPMFMCKASAPHAIEKETMFENKFSMLFIIFWKKKKRLKISVYKLASVCYSFFRHYKIDRLFFSSCRTTQLMVTHVRKTINALILFCKLLL